MQINKMISTSLIYFEIYHFQEDLVTTCILIYGMKPQSSRGGRKKFVVKVSILLYWDLACRYILQYI